MSLISLLLILIVVGVALWLIENYIPLSPPIKVMIRVVVVLVLVIWLLGIFGITGPSVPRVR